MAFIDGEGVCDTEGTPARDDGHFVQRIAFWYEFGYQCMTNFVIGREAFFFVGNDKAASFCTHHDFVFGIFKVAHGYAVSIISGSEKSGFVDQVGEVCSCQSGGSSRQHL